MAPKGHSTRPTADRARQALFNVLEHAAWSRPIEGARVIDLYAGSGALGLEALSRGAEAAILADRDPAAIAAIVANLDSLRLADRGSARRWDATRLAHKSDIEPPFDIAFLDPPYAQGLTAPALASLAKGHWLAPDALVVAEQGVSEPEPAAPGYRTLDSRSWGAARVWFMSAASR